MTNINMEATKNGYKLPQIKKSLKCISKKLKIMQNTPKKNKIIRPDWI